MSTASRILDILVKHDIACRNPKTKKFQLGIGTLAFSYHFQNENQVMEAARPVMQKLVEVTGESVHLGMLYQGKAYMLAQLRSSANRNMREAVIPGGELPFHCTAGGKVMLAWLSEDKQREVAQGKLKAYTKNTITDPELLLMHIKDIKKQNVAFDREEMTENVFCMAVPIVDVYGNVKYCLGLTGRCDFPSTQTKYNKNLLYIQQAEREIRAKLPQTFGYSSFGRSIINDREKGL